MCEYMDVSKCYHYVPDMNYWVVLCSKNLVLDSVLLSREQVSFRMIFFSYLAMNISFILNMDIFN